MSSVFFDLNGFYAWAVHECGRTDVAYSQRYRNQMTVDGVTYYDCSSFVFFAAWLGGRLDIGSLGFSTNIEDYHEGRANAWTVSSMYRILSALEGFQEFDPATDTWQPGDILIKSRTHTEICYAQPRQTMGAHSTANGVSINNYQTSLTYYDTILRYTDAPGPHPPGPTLPLPIWLLKRAIENSKGWC